jgi:hypothetical protein
MAPCARNTGDLEQRRLVPPVVMDLCEIWKALDVRALGGKRGPLVVEWPPPTMRKHKFTMVI